MQIMRWRLLIGTNRSQVRDQLSGKTLGDLAPSLLGTAGSRVFLNTGTANDQTAVVSIADSFRAVHVPTLGQIIPQSGEFVQATVADTAADLLRPVGNEVYRIECIDAQNATLGTLTATITIANKNFPTTSTRVIVASADIAAGSTVSVSIPTNLYIDSEASLMVEASGASILFTAYVAKVVQ